MGMETFWPWALSAGLTANIFFLGMLLRIMNGFKKDVNRKLDEICDQNNESHTQIWDRIHHHKHNGDGKVVITS